VGPSTAVVVKRLPWRWRIVAMIHLQRRLIIPTEELAAS